MSFLSNIGESESVGGLIAFYGLTDWWLTDFTKQERQHINNRYRPMGFPANALAHGKIITAQPVTDFMNILASWFSSKPDARIARRLYDKMEELGRQYPMVGPGYYKGRHYTTYVAEVGELKRADRLDEAESLLIELVKATEAESKAEGYSGVAPFYYEELANIHKSRKDYTKEVAILERYAMQRHAPGVTPPKLLKRLEKTRGFAKKAVD